MNNAETRFLQTVLTSAAVGGIASLAGVGVILALDIFSIGTLISGSAEQGLVSAVMMAGALTKGLAFGAAFGIAFVNRRSSIVVALPAGSPGALAS